MRGHQIDSTNLRSKESYTWVFQGVQGSDMSDNSKVSGVEIWSIKWKIRKVVLGHKYESANFFTYMIGRKKT